MIIFISLLIIALILSLSVISYALTMSSLYYMKIGTIVKHSFGLTTKKILLNTLFVIITYGVVITWFILGNVALYLIGIVVLATIGISYSLLIWILYCNSSYDIYINFEQYPSFYRKGLKKLEKEVVRNA
jgi:hypothetical protein